MKTKLLLAAGITLSLSAFAQTNSQTIDGVEHMNTTPTFRVTVISRSVQAVNYKHRSGASKLDFAGTDLMPAANGQAKVESKKGYTEIEVEFGNLQKPNDIRHRISDLHFVGDFARRPRSQSGRSPRRRQPSQQTGRHHRPAGLRADRYRGTLLRGAPAQQCGRAGKHSSRGHQGNVQKRSTQSMN